MIHNQKLQAAGVEGVEAAKAGKSLENNPYNAGKDHAYFSAWMVGFKSI